MLTFNFTCPQIMENAEINNIIKIVGLQYKKSYDDQESLKSLRYGKIMIMTDQVILVLLEGFNMFRSLLKIHLPWLVQELF